MHVAVCHIKWDERIPGADRLVGCDVDEGEAVVGEEYICPGDDGAGTRGGGCDVAEFEEAVDVEGVAFPGLSVGIRGRRA